MTPKTYYPMYADLQGRACVVIGGGRVAERKALTLLRCGASVTVVSPLVTRRLAQYARQRTIRHIKRAFRPTDVQGAWLVFAATDDQRTNARAYRAATAQRVFVNVVDQRPLCSFIAPAIFRRGPLTVAVSTGGQSPTLAKRVRSDVGQALGEGYVPMLRLLSGLRGAAKRRLPGYQERQRYFDRLVNGPVFRLVRTGRVLEARRAALQLLARQQGKRVN